MLIPIVQQGMWFVLYPFRELIEIPVLTLVTNAESVTLAAKQSFKKIKENLDCLSEFFQNIVPNMLDF